MVFICIYIFFYGKGKLSVCLSTTVQHRPAPVLSTTTNSKHNFIYEEILCIRTTLDSVTPAASWRAMQSQRTGRGSRGRSPTSWYIHLIKILHTAHTWPCQCTSHKTFWSMFSVAVTDAVSKPPWNTVTVTARRATTATPRVFPHSFWCQHNRGKEKVNLLVDDWSTRWQFGKRCRLPKRGAY